MYTTWKIPKRSGGFRIIESPNPNLKKKQRDFLVKWEKELKVSPFAYAFTAYKNIALQAQNHVGKKWVASIDIQDFFPSITLEMFSRIGLREYRRNGGTKDDELAKDLGHCFHDFNDGKGNRLPQGAPTSPLLSNVFLFHFDWRMAWECHRHGCTYSRYADDLVISGDDIKSVANSIKIAKARLQSYRLTVNEKKTKFMSNKSRQLVCGVVVNTKCNLPRKWRKRLRAEVFQQKGKPLRKETLGRLAFQKMVRENTKTTVSSNQMIESVMIAQRLGA